MSCGLRATVTCSHFECRRASGSEAGGDHGGVPAGAGQGFVLRAGRVRDAAPQHRLPGGPPHLRPGPRVPGPRLQAPDHRLWGERPIPQQQTRNHNRFTLPSSVIDWLAFCCTNWRKAGERGRSLHLDHPSGKGE
eukprot:scaffold132821_cov24-Prasinocladus_malaysianus.AAC.1